MTAAERAELRKLAEAQAATPERDRVGFGCGVVLALLDALDAAETTLANCIAERDNYRGAVEMLRGERDEARAMAPRWCRFPTMLTLMVGNVRIGVVGQLADGRWQALPMGGVGVNYDTDTEAARAVCARLGLPYIEVPRE